MDEIILEKMIEYFGYDVRRINHALKVWSFARIIAEREELNEEKKQILSIAAILHDIGIKESERLYNSTAGKYQEKEGPAVAVKLLEGVDLRNEVLNRVCFLIGHHHTYSEVDDLDYQILIEADFLVNIFEDNMGKPEIQSIREKIFKTRAGTKILDEMYMGIE